MFACVVPLQRHHVLLLSFTEMHACMGCLHRSWLIETMRQELTSTTAEHVDKSFNVPSDTEYLNSIASCARFTTKKKGDTICTAGSDMHFLAVIKEGTCSSMERKQSRTAGQFLDNSLDFLFGVGVNHPDTCVNRYFVPVESFSSWGRNTRPQVSPPVSSHRCLAGAGIRSHRAHASCI